MHRWVLVSCGLAALLATPARAGQVRVSLAGIQFTPNSVTIRQGDHVVWVWLSGTHSVTSGSDGAPGGDGIFNSGVVASGASGANTAFSWMSDRTGTVPFYCSVHFGSGMTGTINVLAAGAAAAVADFRLTEVLYAGTNDLIEVANLGSAAGDLGRYRIAVPGDVEGVPLASVTILPGARVVLHLGVNGTNSATDLYLPALSALPDQVGSVALYVPNTIAGMTDLGDASQIIDFVQYGAGGQANEATAVAAGLWSAGESVPTVGAASRSIEFCGTATDHGAASWAEISTPNFGSNGQCMTPVARSSWGRIKALYR